MPTYKLTTSFEVTAPLDRTLAYVQDASNVIGLNENFIRVEQRTETEWEVTEKMAYFAGRTISFPVEWVPQPDGVKIHVAVPSPPGLTVDNLWTVEAVEVADQPRTRITEHATIVAHWYLYPLWPLITRQTRLVRSDYPQRFQSALKQP